MQCQASRLFLGAGMGDVCVMGEQRGKHCSSVERVSGILGLGLNPTHTVDVVFCS